MLYDKDKNGNGAVTLETDREIKDLLYDLESYVIDTFYIDEAETSKTAHTGMTRLVSKVLEEKAVSKAHSFVNPLLSGLGIHNQVKGIRLLEECIFETAVKMICGKSFTMKEIYSKVAAKNNISVSNCERLCRYACTHIELTNELSSRYPCLKALTHRTFEKITVKELVECLAVYLVVDCKFRYKPINDI